MGQDKRDSPKGLRSAERQERLGQALRENLKKRKRRAQARKGENEGSKPYTGKA
jgi:hypothetical protein